MSPVNPEWVAHMRDAIHAIAQRHEEFTTEKVWQYLREQHPGSDTEERRNFGWLVREAKRAGLIEHTGRFELGKRSGAANATHQPIYRSLIYEARHGPKNRP